MLWLFLIKRKTDVFEIFKDFKRIIENKSGESIKFLRTVGRGDYTSLEFGDFWKSEGILHEVIAPYTPQKNGATERRNMTMLNMVRGMLKEKKMPRYF